MLGQLHDLDLQLLRLFVSVVECGGFSAAQGELGLSQSSISQQMAKLETRLGYRLCSRGKVGFKITPKGEQLLIATRALFESIEAFRHQSNGVAGRLIGEVRLGLSEALDQSVLQRVADAIRRFRERDESVRIELISAMPGEMERLLLQQRLDLAIASLRERPERDKIILCLHDGQPVWSGREGRDWDLSIARVTQAERKGIKVIGLFLGEGEEDLRKMQLLFPRLIATTPDRLPEKLGGMLISLA